MKAKNIILKIEDTPLDSFIDSPILVTGWHVLDSEMVELDKLGFNTIVC